MDRDKLLDIYTRTMRVARADEKFRSLLMTGKLAVIYYTVRGQELVSAAMMAALEPTDYLVTTYRGQHDQIAKGVPLDGLFAEIFGKATGTCKGKGGSMHIADFDVGMLGANGIVGAGAPIAVGAAIAAKIDGKGKVAIAFSGDGACNQGTTFEAMNMAVVTKAPAIFVYENNKYSEHTGFEYSVGTQSDIASRAEAFGMKVWRGDGADFFSVHDTMREVLDHVRGGAGPAAVEFDTERFYGHFEGDPQRYRAKGEIERIRDTRDALKNFRRKVGEAKLLDAKELDAIDAEVAALIDEAVAGARAAEKPIAADVLTDVYISY